MTLIILPVDYDVDLERIATIEIESYASSDKSFNEVLFPSTADATKSTGNDNLKSAISRLSSDQNDPSAKFMKVVDTELVGTSTTADPKAIIAFARWKFFTSDKVGHIKYPAREDLPALFGPGCNAEAVKDFCGGLVEAKERNYGRKEYARGSQCFSFYY
jgi:hypothetical protein